MSNSSSAQQNQGALSTLKVLDLTLMLAGPYCTMLLADQGAEVIKIEPPGGEFARIGGPFMPDDVAKLMGGSFVSINRNKKSVVIDLKSESGKEVFLRLVETSDVVVENFRVGVMEKLGLGYEKLKQVNPKLIYACVRGFGDPRTGRSPYSEWPAYDVVTQAMGGIMSVNGPEPDRPMKVGPGVGDIVPGMLTAFGIVSAALHAQKTGEGQFLDVSMYDAALALCERIVYQYSFTGMIPRPQGNSHPMYVPFDVFPAKDGWVTIACPVDEFWKKLCVAMGKSELAEHPDFATLPERVKRRQEVDRLITEWTSARTKSELSACLGGMVPVGPVQDVADIVADEHVAARNMIVDLEQEGLPSTVKIVNTPIKMTRTQGSVREGAPLLGQHTIEVLRAHGFTEQELASLQDSQAIFAA